MGTSGTDRTTSGEDPVSDLALDDLVRVALAGGGNAKATIGQIADAVQVAYPTPISIVHVAISDEATALTAGTNKIRFRMPFAMQLLSGSDGVRASLSTAQASGSALTIDINEAGASILSTKLTIDNTEKTSATAATPVVISETVLDDDAEITIDIDTVGDGTAKGCKVMLRGYQL